MAELPAKERDAVILRFFSGKTHPEIAANQGISEEAAKKSLRAAGIGCVAGIAGEARCGGRERDHGGSTGGGAFDSCGERGAAGVGGVSNECDGGEGNFWCGCRERSSDGGEGEGGTDWDGGGAGDCGIGGNGDVFVERGGGGEAGGRNHGSGERAGSDGSITGLAFIWARYALPPGRVIVNFPDVDQAVREAALRARWGGKTYALTRGS